MVLRGSRRSCQTDGAPELLSQGGPGVGEQPLTLLGPRRAGRSVVAWETEQGVATEASDFDVCPLL